MKRLFLLLVLVSCCAAQSTHVGSITTTTLNTRTWNVAAQGGADAAAKINAAVSVASAGDTLDLSGFSTAQTLSAVVTISKALNIVGCNATFTSNVSDPGTSSGAWNITSDNVTISGSASGKCTLTQGNNKNIQNIVYSGAQGNISIRYVVFNGNETTQTATSSFYTCWRSATGGHDLRLEDSEMTACGSRAVDFRASNRIWIDHNYFHQTGTNIAGQGLAAGGNAISVDGSGAPITISSDVWITNNQFEEWGDSIACANSTRCHITGNTLRGAAEFSHTPIPTESGIDLSGSTYSDATGNTIINVAGPMFNAVCSVGITPQLTPHDITISNNRLFNNTSSEASTDPRMEIGQGGQVCAPYNYTVTGNSYEGARLNVSGIKNFTILGNNFFNIISSTASTIPVNLLQSTGGVTSGFHIEGNTFDTNNSTMSRAVNISNSVTSPGPCTIGPNQISANVSGTYVWQSSAINQCTDTQPSPIFLPSPNLGAALPAAFNTGGYVWADTALSKNLFNVACGDGTGFSCNFYARTGSSSINLLSLSDTGTLTGIGQYVSLLATGTAPFSVASTTPVANLTVSNHPELEDCGSTTTCAKTLKTAALVVRGTVTFPTATTVVITALPFASASSYSCTASDFTTAAGVINATTYTSGASVTFTETGGTNADVIRYSCIGF